VNNSPPPDREHLRRPQLFVIKLIAIFSYFIKCSFLPQGIHEIDAAQPSDTIDKLRTLLVSSAKESAFRKVVQATMVRDRQHGPVIELNRMAVHRKAALAGAAAQQATNAAGGNGALPKSGPAGPSSGGQLVPSGSSKTVFAQVENVIQLKSSYKIVAYI
jgi:hypothetical protein